MYRALGAREAPSLSPSVGVREAEDSELRPRSDPMGEIGAALVLSGAAAARVDNLAVPLDYWRMAALNAALSLNRPVETMANGGTVFAALRDWPAGDEEKRKDRRALRTSAETPLGRGFQLWHSPCRRHAPCAEPEPAKGPIRPKHVSVGILLRTSAGPI